MAIQQVPSPGSEKAENIRSTSTIRDGAILSNNPDAQCDVGFGSYAVAKDTGYTSEKDGKFTDEDRAVVVRTENAEGQVVSLELTVIDGMGGMGKHGDGQIAAEILAAAFEEGGSIKEIVDKGTIGKINYFEIWYMMTFSIKRSENSNNFSNGALFGNQDS